MFTQEEIDFFVENAGKFGEWEPREGDWAIERMAVERDKKPYPRCLKEDGGPDHLVWHIGRTYPDLEEEYYMIGGTPEEIKSQYIPLFTLKQLLGMLAERGYEDIEIYIGPRETMAIIEAGDIEGNGPTPTIALAGVIEVAGNG